MSDWLVRRHGSNAANQSMTPVMAVAIISDCDYETAKRVAEENVHCYNNQHLELVSSQECDSDEWNSVMEDEAMRTLTGEPSCIFDPE